MAYQQFLHETPPFLHLPSSETFRPEATAGAVLRVSRSGGGGRRQALQASNIVDPTVVYNAQALPVSDTAYLQQVNMCREMSTELEVDMGEGLAGTNALVLPVEFFGSQ